MIGLITVILLMTTLLYTLKYLEINWLNKFKLWRNGGYFVSQNKLYIYDKNKFDRHCFAALICDTKLPYIPSKKQTMKFKLEQL